MLLLLVERLFYNMHERASNVRLFLIYLISIEDIHETYLDYSRFVDI